MNANWFQGLQEVPGVGWVESGTLGQAPLAGEADVMMISGLGQEAAVSQRMDNGQVISSTGTFSLRAALTQRVKILGIELPLYVWLLILAGAVGAGWVLLKKMK